MKEDIFEESTTASNRTTLQKPEVELKMYLHFKEKYWR